MPGKNRPLILLMGAVLLLAGAAGVWLWRSAPTSIHDWSPEEKAVLASLSLESLPPLPPDPSNAVGDDPRAVALGHRLFFDTRFSANGQVSCATCHQPERYFTDGLARAHAIGVTPRHAPSIVGAAYSPWFFWDGRKDSQWAQTHGPLESPVEHGGNRTQYAHLVAQHYRDEYQALFGPLPDLSDLERFPPSAGPVADPDARAAWEAMAPEDQDAVNRVFANLGKAIAAYERRILHGPAPFDRYVAAVLAGDRAAAAAILDRDQVAGLRLFMGEARCINCHNGPRFTNDSFHNIGLPWVKGDPLDQGRLAAVPQVLADPFNCLGPYSDAQPEECGELRFMKTQGPELLAAFKTPSLRNVAMTAPYMHTGQFATLAQVLQHYKQAPLAYPGHSQLAPLDTVSQEQLGQIEAFLRSLTGPVKAPVELLAPPAEAGP